jgi:hypothetical protein
VAGTLKEMLKQTALYGAFRNWRIRRMWTRQMDEWERNGRPAPPPHPIKQAAIREHARRFGVRTLVETGTFHGDMVEAMRRDFDRVISIELSEELSDRARRRFATNRNVEIVQGDSGVELGKLLDRISGPVLFWLDGHYSAGETAQGDKDTPIYAELAHIYGSGRRDHVVIIDDARCFGFDADYPTLDELRAFVISMQPDVDFDVQFDSIRITPRIA